MPPNRRNSNQEKEHAQFTVEVDGPHDRRLKGASEPSTLTGSPIAPTTSFSLPSGLLPKLSAASVWIRNVRAGNTTRARVSYAISSKFEVWSGEQIRIEGQTMGVRATSYSRPVEAVDYDFNLSKLERVMSGAGKVTALGHELERRGLKRTIVVTGKTLGGSALDFGWNHPTLAEWRICSEDGTHGETKTGSSNY